MPNRVIVKGNVGNALHSVAPEHILGTADEIFDESSQEYQSEINAGAVRADKDQSLTEEQKAKALENQGVVIAQGSDFTNPDATKRAKVPTVGAVLDGLNDGVYDVSKRNPTGGPNSDGKFTLEYILNNADTLIPTSWRHGGMLISFVDSSDNKYVQYRYMLTSLLTGNFINPANWQGIDNEPIAGSDNLVKSGGVALDIQKITGVIDKEFNLNVGETPSARTKTPCFFKSGDKVVGHVTDGTAVFDTEVTKQFIITFYRADGTTLISHTAIDAYTFTLSENAYFYALYAYKVITAGTVTVHLESTQSINALKEKVEKQENITNPQLIQLINNKAFQSGEKISETSIEDSINASSKKLPTSSAVFSAVESAKSDINWNVIGTATKRINLQNREHSSLNDKLFIDMPAGKYKLKISTVTAVIGEDGRSIFARFYNDDSLHLQSPLNLDEEKEVTLSRSCNNVSFYIFPVETFGDVIVEIKGGENLTKEVEKLTIGISSLSTEIDSLIIDSTDFKELKVEASFEDSKFPINNYSLGIPTKAGQTLNVNMSTTGSVGGGWSIYGKKQNGSTTEIMHYYSAGDKAAELNEDYIDLLLNIPAYANSGTATIRISVKNWRVEVDDAVDKIPSIEDDLNIVKNDVENIKEVIPAYFKDNVSNTVSKSVKDIANTGRNGDNFIFITDIHWESNSKNSLALIQKICDKMNISTVFFGGDAINGTANPDEAISYFNIIAKGLKKSGTRVACVLGNHDWNSQGSGGTKFDNNGETFYAMFQKMADFDVVYGNTAYYYFDNPTADVRYICLDTGPNLTIDTTQAAWIRSVISSTEPSTHIVIIMHSYIKSTSYYEDGEWAGYDEGLGSAGTIVNSIISEFADTKTIEAVFAGHSHFDYNGVTDSMVPVVVTDCDARSTVMWEAETGTITEHSFDIDCVDFINKVITCRRIGRGKSRIIHYSQYQLSVGSTLDISSLLSIVPTSYSVRDNMTAKYVDANVFPNRIIFYNNNATINSNGVVTAIASGYVTAVAENDDYIETFNIKIS